MTLAARLTVLEARRPPAASPAITYAQKEKVARRLLVLYEQDGRDGLAARLRASQGDARAAALMAWVDDLSSAIREHHACP